MKTTAQSGFSLVELGVAMLAAAILGLVVGSILVMMSRNMVLLGVGQASSAASEGLVYVQRDAAVAMVALNGALRGASFSNTVSHNSSSNTLIVWSNTLAGTFAASGSNLLYTRGGSSMTLVSNRLTGFSWEQYPTNAIRVTLVLNGYGISMTNRETIRLRNR